MAKQIATLHCLMPLVFAEVRCLVKWSKCGAVLEYRLSARGQKNSHPFVKHVGSLLSPQQLPVAPCTKPDKYNPKLILYL